ncbi:hypothetical protein GCK72_005351 [Caenorhabditis remanei]|uniref:Uncharacterized protein n=1 Tax=Caenorhabditis remanei TaxID=31234 RepID=A0A6A5HEA7_CAERE|nr:hypothetical protein GCK72_005351 [Caenorhabditis remanei]KAF1765399.1 hypothetical protein GCK72_005351 [Caenorhabditis remanei]
MYESKSSILATTAFICKVRDAADRRVFSSLSSECLMVGSLRNNNTASAAVVSALAFVAVLVISALVESTIEVTNDFGCDLDRVLARIRGCSFSVGNEHALRLGGNADVRWLGLLSILDGCRRQGSSEN